MADTSDTTSSSSHRVRWLLLVVLAIAAVAAGRQWAMSTTDREFEERLRRADERRG